MTDKSAPRMATLRARSVVQATDPDTEMVSEFKRPGGYSFSTKEAEAFAVSLKAKGYVDVAFRQVF